MTVSGRGSGRIKSLDGLRAVAVAAVFVFHDDRVLHLQRGWLGVDLFFVLSGYLITSLLWREGCWNGGIHLYRFWWRRAARLLPGLWLLVVATTVVSAAHEGPAAHAATMHGIGPTLLYYANFAETNGGLGLLQHMWSLSVEEQFYLVWPLVLVLVMRLGRRDLQRARVGLAVCAGAFLATCVIWRQFYYSAHFSGLESARWWDPKLVQVLEADHADMLVWGCAAALAVLSWRVTRRHRRVLGWVGVAGAAAMVFCVAGPVPRWFVLRWEPTIFGASAAVTTVALARTRVPLLGAFLETRLMMWLGEISYGLYLWQFVVVFESPRVLYSRAHPMLAFTCRAALLVALASISYYTVERPIRRAATQRMSRPLWRSAAYGSQRETVPTSPSPGLFSLRGSSRSGPTPGGELPTV